MRFGVGSNRAVSYFIRLQARLVVRIRIRTRVVCTSQLFCRLGWYVGIRIIRIRMVNDFVQLADSKLPAAAMNMLRCEIAVTFIGLGLGITVWNCSALCCGLCLPRLCQSAEEYKYSELLKLITTAFGQKRLQ